jgi:hypothetical protein
LTEAPRVDQTAPRRATTLDTQQVDNALLISLHMLVDQQGGVSYSARECFDWLGEVGFRDCRVQALSESDQLISAVR